jgi:hypothetical protein
VITLQSTADYVTIFALTAIAGMIGGLAAELLLTRGPDTGTFEFPKRKGDFFDFGGFASLLVGAVVGVAVLIVFPPQTTIVTNAVDGTTTTTTGYDIIRVTVTSLVAGSAGGSVLTGLQSRVLAAVNESRVQFTSETAQRQLDQMAAAAAAAAAGQAAGADPAVPGVQARGINDPVPVPGNADAIAAINEALRRQAELGKQAIADAAATGRPR